MLLKWLFTALAILWLIQALRPYFTTIQPPPQQRPPAAPRPDQSASFQSSNEDGEYIDYEEIE